MKLYDAWIADSMFKANGIDWDVAEGEEIDVHGIQMVRMPHGTIVAATKWRESKSEAIASAADRVEELARRMLDQAERMRAEARQAAEGKP